MKYHPDIELLLKYSSGQLEPALTMAIALHHQQCEVCQAQVQELESVGGNTLETLPNSSVGVDDFELLIDKIDDLPMVTPNADYERLAVAESDISLLSQLDKLELDNMPWKRVTPSIWKTELALNDPRYQAELLKFSANAKIPKHTHHGQEFTLVLQGDFSDQQGTYPRGEFIMQDQSNEHQPIAGANGCICLAITDAPLKFTGTFGPILNWLTR